MLTCRWQNRGEDVSGDWTADDRAAAETHQPRPYVSETRNLWNKKIHDDMNQIKKVLVVRKKDFSKAAKIF